VDDALALVELVEILDAEILGVVRQRCDLFGALRIGIWLAAVGGRHVVIDDGERLVRRMHLAAGGAQTLEGLRARHLVHQMTVDIEETSAVRLFVYQMVVPDFVVERTRFHGQKALFRLNGIVANGRRCRQPIKARPARTPSAARRSARAAAHGRRE
jgi:hypothetical protein